MSLDYITPLAGMKRKNIWENDQILKGLLLYQGMDTFTAESIMTQKGGYFPLLQFCFGWLTIW